MNAKIEMPDFLPPLPPVPEGYDRWEYRGEGWRCDDGPATTYACATSAAFNAKHGHPHEWNIREDRWPEGMGFYIEAVKGMPDNLPPLPPVPEGYDRWEYRGMGIAGLRRYTCYGGGYTGWIDQPLPDLLSAGASYYHYLEAVKDEPQAETTISEPDMVNSPPHYTTSGIECIDAIRAALTPEEFRGFCKGNALKYTWREKHKGGDQDLAKAAWYLNKLKEGQP
jgi:hypothetical protein